jgi:hypothetical protein
MLIADEAIRTPLENPWDFQTNWRNEVARLVCQHHPWGNYDYDADRWIRAQVQYLDSTTKDGHEARVSSMCRRVDLRHDERYGVAMANNLYTSLDRSNARYKCEAMLLCGELSYNQIAKALTDMSPVIVKAYERIFYSVRDAKGEVLAAPWLREYFAKGQAVDVTNPNDHGMFWKVKAIEGGWKALHTTWNWPIGMIGGELPEAEFNIMLFREALNVLDHRLKFDRLDARSIPNLVDSLHRMVTDMRERGVISQGDSISEDSAMMTLVQAMQPYVKVPSMERLAQKQEAVDQKISMIKKMDRSHDGGSDTLDRIGAQLTTQ